MDYSILTGNVTVVINVLLAALFITFFCDVKNVMVNLGFHKKHFLIIGLLSSRENFESRTSLRETWLKDTSDFSLAYHFIVGNYPCRVHPVDRVSPYTCVENQLTLPENVTSETEFSVLSPRKIEEKKPNAFGKVRAIGFGFQTLRAITIRKLGVIKHVFNQMSNVRVKLRSSETMKVLASVTLTRDVTADESEFVMKPIPPLLLQPNMEVQLVTEFMFNIIGLVPSCDDFQWNYIPGVISYLQLIQLGDRKPWPFSLESCSYASMNYTITDVNLLTEEIVGKEERRRQWRKKVEDISRRLKNESDFYGDITFVDVVDVYRNLPRKLARFFRRLAGMHLFHYVLKTDDDSFIDVARVYKQLEVLNEELSNESPNFGLLSEKFWWWSNYREFWKVQETGKWREDEYRSAAYPSFPCGGGYVLSKGIVDYVAQNENLRYFQGEDVSMGIWLSALKTIQHRSSFVAVPFHSVQERIIKKYSGKEAWIKYINASNGKLVPDMCEWTCDKTRTVDVPQCNIVELTPAGMREIWMKYKRQGFV